MSRGRKRGSEQLSDPSIVTIAPDHCAKVRGSESITVERVVACLKKTPHHGYVRYRSLHVLVKRTGDLNPTLPRYRQTWASCDRGEAASLWTPRELDILRLLCQPLSSQDITRRLCISHFTLKNYTSAIYAQIGVHSRLEAVLWALKNGTVSLDEVELPDGSLAGYARLGG